MAEKLAEKVVREVISTGGRERTDSINHRVAAAPGHKRFDRTFDEKEWPTSGPVSSQPSSMKVVWKHDSAPGAKE